MGVHFRRIRLDDIMEEKLDLKVTILFRKINLMNSIKIILDSIQMN
jgi:hypothetical protein